VRSPAPPQKPTRIPQTRTASATLPPLSRVPARSFSPVALLGAALVFFLVAVGVAGYVIWKRTAASVEAEKAPPVVVATPTPPPITVPPANGLIHVETTPPGAAISLNGELKGSSPLDLTGLAMGDYEVRAELKGYEPKAASATILESASQTQVVLALTRVAPVTGGLEVVSQPPGGDVTVDGTRAGLTPIADLRLRPGSHQVAIALEGYDPWSGSVNVEAGKKTRLDAALQATPKATPTPAPAPAVDATKTYLNTASEVDTLAKKSSGNTASYPSNATRLKSGESVSVSVTFVVDENGDVSDVKVVESGGAVIDDAVVKAIRKWKYSPAEKQGVNVKVRIAFKQTFRAG
jgi:TonB family protein